PCSLLPRRPPPPPPLPHTTLFRSPSGIAVPPSGDLYVSDASNHRVQRFTHDGTWLGSFGTSGSAPGQFGIPAGIAVDRSGSVLVGRKGRRLTSSQPIISYDVL